MSGRKDDATRGLSLLELVVAMALFALVAVMGMQTLGGTLRTRDSLQARDSRDTSIAVTLALLRHDLDRAVPQLFTPRDAPAQSALQALPEGFGLTILPEARAVLPRRVEWRRDPTTGQVSRRSWAGLSPPADQAPPWRVVQDGIDSMRIRVLDADDWRDLPDSTLTATLNDTLPRAIELRLEIAGIGPLRLLEVLP